MFRAAVGDERLKGGVAVWWCGGGEGKKERKRERCNGSGETVLC